MTQKIYHLDKILCHHQKFFFFKKLFKVSLQYLFNGFVLFNIVFNLKLNLKQKIDQKMHTYKNLKEIRKKEWQP